MRGEALEAGVVLSFPPRVASESPMLSVPVVTGVLAVWRGTVQGHFKFSPNWALGDWPGKTSINICLFLLSLTLT